MKYSIIILILGLGWIKAATEHKVEFVVDNQSLSCLNFNIIKIIQSYLTFAENLTLAETNLEYQTQCWQVIPQLMYGRLFRPQHAHRLHFFQSSTTTDIIYPEIDGFALDQDVKVNQLFAHHTKNFDIEMLSPDRRIIHSSGGPSLPLVYNPCTSNLQLVSLAVPAKVVKYLHFPAMLFFTDHSKMNTHTERISKWIGVKFFDVRGYDMIMVHVENPITKIRLELWFNREMLIKISMRNTFKEWYTFTAVTEHIRTYEYKLSESAHDSKKFTTVYAVYFPEYLV